MPRVLMPLHRDCHVCRGYSFLSDLSSLEFIAHKRKQSKLLTKSVY